MTLARAFRPVIAVESQTVQREKPQPEPPDPEAGDRWGRPASFEFAMPEPQPDGAPTITNDWVDKARRLRGVESHRDYVTAAATVGGTTLTPEAIRSVTFHLGSREVRHEKREVRGGVTNVTPVIETIEHYVRFTFPFGDPEGSRGEPAPPPTPPMREPADYD